MKTNLSILSLSIIAILILSSASANADELNMGKSTPSAKDIISHMTAPADGQSAPAEGSSTPEAADDDISSQLSKTRGLAILPAGHPTAHSDKSAKVRPSHPAGNTSKPEAANEVAVSMEVLFDYNSANLSTKAKEQLTPIAEALQSPEMKGMRFKIEGHTDASGRDEYNIELSERRAQSVKDYLTGSYGIDSSAIVVEGKGKNGLALPDDPTNEANRRVRLVKLGS